MARPGGRCRRFRLPISLRGTQWEAMLLGQEYRDRPPDECPAVIAPSGETIRKLSPFGPLEPWRDPAGEYVDTPAMKKLQQMFPDPPLVLLVSNNEAPDLRWHQVEELSQRYLDKYGKGRTDDFKRRVVARGWMERYPVMFAAMREALVSKSWRDNVRFVGYGAFGPSHFGRWAQWKEYSLITDEWTSPNWHIWDGVRSVGYSTPIRRWKTAGACRSPCRDLGRLRSTFPGAGHFICWTRRVAG